RVGSTGNSTGPHLHLEPDLARLYDFGGIVPHRGIAVNMSGGPELMLPPHISRILMNLSSQTPRQTAAPESTPKKEPVVGPSKLEGRLYLDSGELLGVVRGIVTSEVDEFARNRAAGRRYG